MTNRPRNESGKKRILLILSSDLFVRNYLQTDALSMLGDAHEIIAVAASTVKTAEGQSNWPIRDRFVLDPVIVQRHSHLMEGLGWRYRKRSPTFSYRLSRLLWDSPLERGWAYPLRLMRRFAQIAKVVVLRSWPASIWTIDHEIKSIPINHDLIRIIESTKPDLIVCPSATSDAACNDAFRIGKSKNIPTLCLVDNWDNLSSKTIMWSVPDYLCVWGQQTREHARDIQRIPETRVFPIGTPRFEIYFSNSDSPENAQSPYDFPYVLYCGCSIPFDELTSLRLLEKEIAENPGIYGPTKIVYRPHPWRQRRLSPDVFNESDFRHIVLDRQIKQAYETNQKSTEFQPAMEYYPRLIKNAKFVIGPLTTMLIESLICGQNVLAIAYDDAVHKSSPHNALKYYVHFRGIERLKQLTLAHTQAEYITKFRAIHQMSAGVKNKPAALDPYLSYFITHAPDTYPARLLHAVNNILQSNTIDAS
jgi:hypothetical protein